ncbi:MAG TPA: SRPBCC family protein [Candidatus Dormibacteraeota bacterium]
MEKEITVDVPIQVAYNQWTQFEEFPQFMEGVREVRQLDDRSLHWKAEIAGRLQEWDAVITDQEPDRVIGWRSTSGAPNAGNVHFDAEGPDRTRVRLHMMYEPQGPIEGAVDALGFVSRQVEGDLQRFKTFIEGRGRETGAWRGEIHQAEPRGTQNPET